MASGKGVNIGSLIIGALTGAGGVVWGGTKEYLDQNSDKKIRIGGMQPVNEICSEHNGKNKGDDPRYDLYNYGLPPEK